jgi:hypothetical protein
MKPFILLFSILVPACMLAQDYNAELIPDSLLKSADVVKRNEEYILTIKSPSKHIIYEKHTYTILNSSGSNYAHYLSYYDKFSSINSVTGKLFNKTGKQIKHSKKSDWKDQSAFDGFSLLSDTRYKENEFYSADYPYTVEYEEEVESTGTLDFPDWLPQGTHGVSVQQSTFTIVAPADYNVRYRQFNFSSEPRVTRKGDLKTYTWEIKNLPAKKYEISGPSFSEIAPAVFFAPSKFEIQGYSGDMSNWNDLGKFMYELVKGRDILPEDIKRKVHALTDGLNTEREKIFILYDFLQKNTRYISVQLGIGGWQPFEANYVAEKKYGDCKALSNYMIALLKEAGIKGKYVEIYGGASPPHFINDFSFSQFNHVICCVPLAKDTVWLECTSQTASPGYLGSFTGNRKALLIDETGGHLVHTVVYGIADNIQKRIVSAVTDQQGNLTAEINNTYTGLQQDLPHALMYDLSKEDRQKYLNQMFTLPTYEVIESSYREEKGIIPVMKEHLRIQLNNYANITGKRFFITPNIFGENSGKLLPDTTRKYDYIIRNSYRDIDSVEIKIPAGYKPEMLPKDISLSNKFGKYASSAKLSGETIIYYRLWEQFSGRYPATEYNDLVKFYQQVYRADRSKIVLIKAE